ncbi:MAG: AraC family transcriptional regulator [Pseudomonadota bacterium]
MPTFKPAAHHFVRHPGLPHLELRTATSSRDCYQTHTHDEYSFGIIDAGQAVYTHGPNSTALKPGMTVMMEPGLAHACNPDAQQAWSYRMLFVDAQWVHQSFLPLAGATHPTRLQLAQHSTDKPAVYLALGRIADALVHRSTDALEVDEWLLTFIAQHALVPRVTTTQPGADEQAVHAVRALICAQVERDLSLAQLAQASGLDAYQLIRKFKQAFGQTPHAFQIDQRLNRAKTLLKQGAGLADVAHQLGFADQAHFQRHFKKRHATTPGNYMG